MSWTDEDVRDVWDVARSKSNGRYIVSDNPDLVMERLKDWKSIGKPGIFSVWFELNTRRSGILRPIAEPDEIDRRIPGVGC